MGNKLLSFNSHPDMPRVLRPDPMPEETFTVETARLGMLGFTDDFGVWENERPSSSRAQGEEMWLWIKRRSSGHTVTIELENFDRGVTQAELTSFDREIRHAAVKQAAIASGKTLYAASFQDTSGGYEAFHRYAHEGEQEHFTGLFTDDHPLMRDRSSRDRPDLYYLRHPKHRDKIFHFQTSSDGFASSSSSFSQKAQSERERLLDCCLVSKWMYSKHVHILDGSVGRGQAFFNTPTLLLEIVAKGTVVTNYVERMVLVDAQGRPLKDKHQSNNNSLIARSDVQLKREIDKIETDFVDQIEYRLVTSNVTTGAGSLSGPGSESHTALLVGEWLVPGDAEPEGQGTGNGVDVIFRTPFFQATVKGGWFSRTRYHIDILSAANQMDSALSLLLAHLCLVEFSVSERFGKDGTKVRTPDTPPSVLTRLLRYDPLTATCRSTRPVSRFQRNFERNASVENERRLARENVVAGERVYHHQEDEREHGHGGMAVYDAQGNLLGGVGAEHVVPSQQSISAGVAQTVFVPVALAEAEVWTAEREGAEGQDGEHVNRPIHLNSHRHQSDPAISKR
jgi:hypothetical protein